MYGTYDQIIEAMYIYVMYDDLTISQNPALFTHLPIFPSALFTVFPHHKETHLAHNILYYLGDISKTKIF